jgi:hypothetical protein
MMKKCSKCGEEKPATPEYFHTRRDTACGVVSVCRQCRNKTSPIPPPQPEDYLRFGLQPNDDMKRCTTCEEYKPATFEYFYRQEGGKCGIASACKVCRIIQTKKYGRQWHKDTYEKRKPKYRKYYQDNKEEIKSKAREYKKENWDKIAHERKHNPKVKLPHAIGRTINNQLKKAGAKKSQATAKYLGCTIAELMTHLENQFQEGMSWNNHGLYGWHIDHIRPCASFDLTDKKQAKQCFHHTNLQPLWAEDNLRKGAKYEPEEFAEVNRDSETTLPDLLCEESEVPDVPLCLSVEEESSDFNRAEQS